MKLHALAGATDFLKANVRASGYFRVAYSHGLWSRAAAAAAAPHSQGLFSQASLLILVNHPTP